MTILLLILTIIYLASVVAEIILLTKYYWKCSVFSLFSGMDFTTAIFLFMPILNTAVVIIGVSDLIKKVDDTSYQS